MNLEDKEVILRQFFTEGKYTISFNQHRDTTEFQSISKARVKDIDKIVDRKHGKMPRCDILQFTSCRFIINLDDLEGIDSIPNGIVLKMEYDIRIERMI